MLRDQTQLVMLGRTPYVYGWFVMSAPRLHCYGFRGGTAPRVTWADIGDGLRSCMEVGTLPARDSVVAGVRRASDNTPKLHSQGQDTRAPQARPSDDPGLTRARRRHLAHAIAVNAMRRVGPP